MRANTQGCTEWSCIYHGEDNREKSRHDDACPVYNFTGSVISPFTAVPSCECSKYIR